MSYDIYIGNTEMQLIEDEEEVTPYSRFVDGKIRYYEPVVNEIRQPDAPTFPNDDMTGNSNNRHPGYSQWSEFLRIAGLYDLFFNRRTGLMRQHPGHAELQECHAQAIEQALMRWKASHPDAQPGFEAFSWGEDVPEVGYDSILARLIWLDWWVKWALEHCEHAAIYNF